MRIIKKEHVSANSGWGTDITASQVLRLTATTIIDFVCLDRAAPRFGQAIRATTLEP